MEEKKYWENKIIGWEKARYSPWMRVSPFAWSVRSRLHMASEIIYQRADRNWKILELGCGSGYLAQTLQPDFSHYVGLDIAENAIGEARFRFLRSTYEFFTQDVRRGVLPKGDLAVFLGLTDWISPAEFQDLLSRIEAPNLLFSFTDAAKVNSANPYRWYRNWRDHSTLSARAYTYEDVRKWLWQAGFKIEIVQSSSWKNPGVLVWSTK
jgi:SAM-dependent methyltransferase